MNKIVKQKIIRRIENDVPKKYQKIYKKALLKRKKSAAIKAFCLECTCWQENEIINCNSISCPLHELRQTKLRLVQAMSGRNDK